MKLILKISMNYKKLKEWNPTEYGRMTNSLGQEIIFVEHPIHGDEVPVIVMFPDQERAFRTDFFELDDMTAEHGEYEPRLIDGELCYGR